MYHIMSFLIVSFVVNSLSLAGLMTVVTNMTAVDQLVKCLTVADRHSL